MIILSYAQLKFKLAYDLGLSNNKWNFKIKVSENNLDNKRNIIVDFKEDYYYRTALCNIEENNELFCESINLANLANSKLYLINDSSNKYVKWTNLVNNEPIYVILHINLINMFGCFMENIWKFNIKYEGEFHNYYSNKNALLDILVNNETSTANCEISNSMILKCVSKHNNQKINDVIMVPGLAEPNSGTVYFIEELNENQKNFNATELEVNLLKINGQNFYNNKLSFSVIGSLPDDYKINYAATLTEIEISVNKENGEISTSRAICDITYNYVYGKNEAVLLECITDNQVSSKDEIKINIDSYGNSKFIKFK